MFFSLDGKESKDQGCTGLAATAKDYAVAAELASLKQPLLLARSLSPSLYANPLRPDIERFAFF